MVLFLAYSFFSVEQGTIVHTPTLANYARFFADPIFLPIFWRTCLLCLARRGALRPPRLSRRLLPDDAARPAALCPAHAASGAAPDELRHQDLLRSAASWAATASSTAR